MFLAPSCSGPGESILITTLLGIPLGEPDGNSWRPPWGLSPTVVRRTRWLLSTTTRCSKKAPPSASAPRSSSLTDQAASKAVQSTRILQKFQKPRVNMTSTTSSTNSKKSNSQLSTMKPEFNPNSAHSRPKHSPNWKKTWKDY